MPQKNTLLRWKLKTFILGNNDMDAESGVGYGDDVAFANIDSIQAKADSAAVQVEYFIASLG